MFIRHKTRHIFVALVASLFLVISPNITHAQLGQDGRWENGVSESWWFGDKFPHEEIATVTLRWKVIGDENAVTQANEWAGDYFVGGDTHGSYLRLSPSNDFVLVHVDKCAASVMGFSYGKFNLTPDSILFVTEKFIAPSDTHSHSSGKVTSRFLPVKWRGLHYVVSENQIGDFSEWVAGLGKYNAGLAGYWSEGLPFFLKRAEKETGTADELPVVPAGYEHFLKRPIDAQITSVGRRVVMKRQNTADDEPYYESETTVTLNVGSAHGVKVGMTFQTLDADSSDEVKIQKVRGRTSTGIIVRFVQENASTPSSSWKDSEDANYAPIVAGSQLTTSFHKVADLMDAKPKDTER